MQNKIHKEKHNYIIATTNIVTKFGAFERKSSMFRNIQQICYGML